MQDRTILCDPDTDLEGVYRTPITTGNKLDLIEVLDSKDLKIYAEDSSGVENEVLDPVPLDSTLIISGRYIPTTLLTYLQALRGYKRVTRDVLFIPGTDTSPKKILTASSGGSLALLGLLSNDPIPTANAARDVYSPTQIPPDVIKKKREIDTRTMDLFKSMELHRQESLDITRQCTYYESLGDFGLEIDGVSVKNNGLGMIGYCSLGYFTIPLSPHQSNEGIEVLKVKDMALTSVPLPPNLILKTANLYISGNYEELCKVLTEVIYDENS